MQDEKSMNACCSETTRKHFWNLLQYQYVLDDVAAMQFHFNMAAPSVFSPFFPRAVKSLMVSRKFLLRDCRLRPLLRPRGSKRL